MGEAVIFTNYQQGNLIFTPKTIHAKLEPYIIKITLKDLNK